MELICVANEAAHLLNIFPKFCSFPQQARWCLYRGDIFWTRCWVYEGSPLLKQNTECRGSVFWFVVFSLHSNFSNCTLTGLWCAIDNFIIIVDWVIFLHCTLSYQLRFARSKILEGVFILAVFNKNPFFITNSSKLVRVWKSIPTGNGYCQIAWYLI